MESLNFDEVVEQIVAQDPRYDRQAYYFLREALDHTHKRLGRPPREGEIRHVTGQQLLEGLRDYALTLFGPMTLTVFHEWGIRRPEDFGEIVFIMVDHHLLAKTEQDSREDFKGVLDFDQAFRQPFQPRGATPKPPPLPKQS